MLLAGIFYMLCTALFARRFFRPESLLGQVQLKMRLPLHLLTYCLALLLFCRHIGLPNMGSCSPIDPNFSALEALAIYLLWVAAYPVMAAIPLRYALPVQVAAFVALTVPTNDQCQMGDICSKTDYMYRLYSTKTSHVSSLLPITVPTNDDFSADIDCRVVMTFLKARDE